MNTRSALEFSPGAAGPVLDDDPLAWQALADCQYSDPDAWFPEKGESSLPAKRICASCPVRLDCLEYALENHEMRGVWGGMSPRERSRLKLERAASAPPPAVRHCAKGIHLMNEANTSTDGRCTACRNAWARNRDREQRHADRLQREAQEEAA